ncbi:hypothetical protein RDWZM_008163, partial [Blomia tropicalis]
MDKHDHSSRVMVQLDRTVQLKCSVDISNGCSDSDSNSNSWLPLHSASRTHSFAQYCSLDV